MRDLRPDEKPVRALRVAISSHQAAHLDPVVAGSLASKDRLALDRLVHVVAVASVLLVDVRDALSPGRVKHPQPGVEYGRVGDRSFDLERKPLSCLGRHPEYVN